MRIGDKMAAKKRSAPRVKRAKQQPAATREGSPKATRSRLRRSDEDKIRLVRQIMESGNRGAEIKKLGIYPNQFYDWKKKYSSQLGGAAATTGRGKRGGPGEEARTVADEAKAYIQGKAALLTRLRSQRSELDELIAQLES
jgi:transposase-like protein